MGTFCPISQDDILHFNYPKAQGNNGTPQTLDLILHTVMVSRFKTRQVLIYLQPHDSKTLGFTRKGQV